MSFNVKLKETCSFKVKLWHLLLQLQAQLQAQRPSAPSKGIWKAAPTSAADARRPPQASHVKAAPKPVVFRGAQAQAMRF